jgi:hypothetical protein
MHKEGRGAVAALPSAAFRGVDSSCRGCRIARIKFLEAAGIYQLLRVFASEIMDKSALVS